MNISTENYEFSTIGKKENDLVNLEKKQLEELVKETRVNFFFEKCVKIIFEGVFSNNICFINNFACQTYYFQNMPNTVVWNRLQRDFEITPKEELIQIIKETRKFLNETRISGELISKKVKDGNSIFHYCLTDTSEGIFKLVKSVEKVCQENEFPFPSWEKHPVLLSEEDFNTMDFPHVLKILKGDLQSPSEGTDSKKEELCEIAFLLDSLFKEAIENYADKLCKAANGDDRIIKRNKEKGSKAAVMKRTSCFRVKWLQEVDIWEKERIEQSREIIINRCQSLYNDLQELDEGLIDKKKMAELEQLAKIHRYLTKSQFIPIGKTTVRQYLEKINESIETN